MTQTYYFKGTVTAEEPLTVSVTSSDKHRLPRNGGYRATPFMPATSFRGALRHACHKVVNRFIQQKGDRFEIEDHFALAQGIDINKKKSKKTAGAKEAQEAESLKVAIVLNDAAIDSSVKLRQTNPFISIWGRWGLDSRSGIGNMYPTSSECTAEFGGGFRGVMFERNPETLAFLNQDELNRIDSILAEQSNFSEASKPMKAQEASLKKSLRKVDDEEAKNKILAKLNEVQAALQTAKENKVEAEEAIRRPIDTYEAFVAGCTFSHRMCLQNVQDGELGLFISSLAEFARNPYLGGHRAHNCGLVSAEYTVSIYPEDADQHIEVGKIRIDDNGFHISGDALIAARAAWKSDEIDFKKW